MKLIEFQNIKHKINLQYFIFIKCFLVSIIISLIHSSNLFAINYPLLTQKGLIARCNNQVTVLFHVRSLIFEELSPKELRGGLTAIVQSNGSNLKNHSETFMIGIDL